MGNVKIKQFSDKNKELIAGLTPEHAVYDVKGVRLDAKIGSILDIKNTVATQGKNLDNLTLKVNALAVGVFYGYASNKNELPQDITERGYAYVGTDNPYKIYNFDGTQWKDSGTTIQATSEADEEDITYNENDKLTFKDRNNTNGMGYIILRKNKTFAEQVTKENTIYEIRYDFTLNGNVTIPANCVLQFNGGRLNNGNITFNTTLIKGDTSKIFNNCVLSGNIAGNKLHVASLGIYPDRPDIDATSIIVASNVINLQAITLIFEGGNYYFREWYIAKNGTNKNNYCLEGNTDGMITDRKTCFLPFEDNQRYIIKCGGGADTFRNNYSTNTRDYNSSIKHISFSNNNRTIRNNSSVEGVYECGLLVLDCVEIGYYDVHFYGVVDCPALFIGFVYECDFSNVSVYGHSTKSNCCAVYFGSNSNAGAISSTTFGVLRGEVILGSFIGGPGTIQEMSINQMFFEGSQMWNNMYVEDCDPTYFKNYSEGTSHIIDSYKQCYKVPVINFSYSPTIQINYLSLQNVNGRWKNTADGDNIYKTNCILSSKLAGNISIGTLNTWASFNHFIGSTNKDYPTKLFIGCFYTNSDEKRGYDDNSNYDSYLSYVTVEDYLNLKFGNDSLNAYYGSLPSIVSPYDNIILLNSQNIKNYGYPWKYDNNIEAIRTTAKEFYLFTRDILSTCDYGLSLLTMCTGSSKSYTITIKYYNLDGTINSSFSKSFAPHSIYKENNINIPKIDNTYFRVILYRDGNELFLKQINITEFGRNLVTAGTFSEKPTNVSIGFRYFCTDKQTTEGATDGIEIIHKGNDVWVDALGRVIS